VFFFSLVRGEKSGWKLRERVSRCRALRFIRFSKHFLAVEVPNKTQKKKKKKKKSWKSCFFLKSAEQTSFVCVCRSA
jgi:hypothetical protein